MTMLQYSTTFWAECTSYVYRQSTFKLLVKMTKHSVYIKTSMSHLFTQNSKTMAGDFRSKKSKTCSSLRLPTSNKTDVTSNVIFGIQNLEHTLKRPV